MTRLRVIAAAIIAALCIAAVAAQDCPPRPVFSVAGCVNSAGTFEWAAGATVEKAIELAGGYAGSGEGSATIRDVTILRMVDKKLVKLQPTSDTPVLANDRISVGYPK